MPSVILCHISSVQKKKFLRTIINIRHFLNNLILSITKFFKVDSLFFLFFISLDKLGWTPEPLSWLRRKRKDCLNKQSISHVEKRKKGRPQNQLMREERELKNDTGLMSVNEVQDNAVTGIDVILSILYCMV